MIHSLATLVVAGVLALPGAPPQAPAAGEQDRISDTLASSSLRMLQAGFWSVGPGTRDGDFVSACLGGVDSPGRLAPMPGEIARGVSNVYLFQPDADGAPDVGELVTVAVVTVDAANESTLDWFVLLLGRDETAACRRDEWLAARAADPVSAEVEATVSADATPELGVGDASSRIDMQIVFQQASGQQRVTYSFLVGRVSQTLVIVRRAGFGAGPFSGFDPASELAAIVAEFAES